MDAITDSAPPGQAARRPPWLRAPRRSGGNFPPEAGCGWLMALILVWHLCCAVPQLQAEPVKLTEGQVKAAYLYNFVQYVEWPAAGSHGSGAPLVISVLGNASFGGALEALGERTVKKRRVVLRYLRKIEDLEADSQVLFICASERGQLARILSLLQGRPVLTVSDMDRFAEAGGIISLVNLEDRMRFVINLKAARQAELKLSAHLLKLALSIIE